MHDVLFAHLACATIHSTVTKLLIVFHSFVDYLTTSYQFQKPGRLSDTALSCGLDDRGFESRRRVGIYLFTTASRPALRPTQSLIQWVSWALTLGVKLSGREADHSPLSSAEVKECVELYLHSPNTPSWRGAQLKKVQGWLYFYLPLTLSPNTLNLWTSIPFEKTMNLFFLTVNIIKFCKCFSVLSKGELSLFL
jgi:hypothetical protein